MKTSKYIFKKIEYDKFGNIETEIIFESNEIVSLGDTKDGEGLLKKIERFLLASGFVIENDSLILKDWLDDEE